MGFVNEYKAAKTAEALHSSVRHSCVVLRDGHPRTVDVTDLVPGDVVDLQLARWFRPTCGCWPWRGSSATSRC
jgi:magnesium-transporting ATPase (P-type)